MKMKSMKTTCCTSAAARPFCAARARSSSCPHPPRYGSGLAPQTRGYGLEHALRRGRALRRRSGFAAEGGRGGGGLLHTPVPSFIFPRQTQTHTPSTGMRRSNLRSTILTSGREIAMCACWLLGLLMLYGKRASTYIADNVAERLRRCTRKFLG